MTVVLSSREARILGALIEKAATTPDGYPLSTNALRLACNQTTNRDPIVDYDERTIDTVMMELRQRGLARTVNQPGSRVAKHRHVFDEALGLAPDELAVMAVLLLRGPQTVAELAARTERYPGAPQGVAGVEAAIDRLAAERGGGPVVARLGRRPGEREPRIGHLLADPSELPAPAGAAPAAGLAPDQPPPAAMAARPGPLPGSPVGGAVGGADPGRGSPSTLGHVRVGGPDPAAGFQAEVDGLRRRVEELEAAFARQEERLERLVAELGG